MLIFESTSVALAQFKDFFSKVSYVFGFLFLKKKTTQNIDVPIGFL